MFTSLNDALSFQREQQDIVIRIGAYLSPIKDFIEKSKADPSYADDINNIRRLQPHVGEQAFIVPINQFLNKYNYSAYYQVVATPYHQFAHQLADQTLSSKKKTASDFIKNMETLFNMMAEALIVIAHIPSPPQDINIKAQSPFQAYCFFTNLFASIKEFLYLIDPYIDASLFHNYFFRMSNTINIQIVSSINKWNKSIKDQVESVEALFGVEYPNYKRKDLPELHDRFVITETSAYQLGGSLKDAAKKADFSVVQVSESRRLDLIDVYFKEA